MGTKFEKHSIAQIEIIADSLMRSARSFATILQEMQGSGMQEAYLEWSKRHGLALALMAGASRAATSMIAEQAVSHRSGEPSFYDRQKEKTKRQTEKQRETRAAENSVSESPPRKVGRPKKSK